PAIARRSLKLQLDSLPVCCSSHDSARFNRSAPIASSGKSAANAVTHVLSATSDCGLQPPSFRCIEYRNFKPASKLGRSTFVTDWASNTKTVGSVHEQPLSYA